MWHLHLHIEYTSKVRECMRIQIRKKMHASNIPRSWRVFEFFRVCTHGSHKYTGTRHETSILAYCSRHKSICTRMKILMHIENIWINYYLHKRFANKNFFILNVFCNIIAPVANLPCIWCSYGHAHNKNLIKMKRSRWIVIIIGSRVRHDA